MVSGKLRLNHVGLKYMTVYEPRQRVFLSSLLTEVLVVSAGLVWLRGPTHSLALQLLGEVAFYRTGVKTAYYVGKWGSTCGDVKREHQSEREAGSECFPSPHLCTRFPFYERLLNQICY